MVVTSVTMSSTSRERNPTIGAIKNIVSAIALLWSCVLVGALIFSRQTAIAKDVHPVVALILLLFCLAWLSILEGGQASLVGLAPVHRDLYKDSHPTAYRCTAVSHAGDNLERHFLGRQFLVVLIVFTINQSGNAIADATLWGLPHVVLNIFLGSGLAVILLTTVIGVLSAQVNAAYSMLDYLNTSANYITIMMARFVEATGLLHASYLIQNFVAAVAGERVESKEPPRTCWQNIFFFGRCFVSLAILMFALAVTLVALFNDQTTMWQGVPPGVAIVVFVILLAVVGMLEGMQIAFLAVSRIPKSDRGYSFFAKQTCGIIFSGEAENLARFMIGRQLCYIACTLFIARVTTLDIDPHGDHNLFGVSSSTETFFNLGFLGALMTTILASIGWQLVASAFPFAFLNSPITYLLLRLCLFLESTGICHIAYIIARIHKKLAGMQRDEVYIGTAEERQARNMQDDMSVLSFGPGHIVQLPIMEMSEKVQLPSSTHSTLFRIEETEDGSDKDEETGL